MSAAESRATTADHRPYIETVRVALLLKGIQVGTAAFNAGQVRSAAMTVLPPDDDFDEPWAHSVATAEHVALRWNEEEGWSLLAMHASDGTSSPTIWRLGPVVLPFDDICAWLAALLTAPALSSSQEDRPYRAHQRRDPAFEACLADYAL